MSVHPEFNSIGWFANDAGEVMIILAPMPNRVESADRRVERLHGEAEWCERLADMTSQSNTKPSLRIVPKEVV